MVREIFKIFWFLAFTSNIGFSQKNKIDLQDLTAEKVIANYIDAIGGAKKIQEVKTIKTIMKTIVQGNELTSTVTKKFPGMSFTEISVMGNVIQKSITDGKEVVSFYNGKKKSVDDAISKEWYLFEAYVIPEMMLVTMKVKTTLKEVEMLDGKETFVVEYLLPAGERTMNYFNKETGLKVKMIEYTRGLQGEVAAPTGYLNYKDVNGIKFPRTIVKQGVVEMNFRVSSIEVNLAVDDSIFKIQ